MGDKSKIQWTDATWNPVTGCTKVSPGCKNCYAETVAKRFWKDRKFTDVQCHADRLVQPLRWRRPRMVFVNSMSDLFHPAVPFEFICAVFNVMKESPNHTFQILTKRPERMLEFIDWDRKQLKGLSQLTGVALDPLLNVWLGVSVEDQATANERIPPLLQCPAAVRFVSYEPALEAVNFEHIKLPGSGGCHYNALSGYYIGADNKRYERGKIDWLICGGESGPNARRFDVENGINAMRQCDEAGVPFFWKQMGSRPFIGDPQEWLEGDMDWDSVDWETGRIWLKDKMGANMSEWPAELRRRELPESVRR